MRDFNDLLAQTYGGNQSALARDIGYSRGQVNRWSNGRDTVPLVVLKYLRLRVILDRITDAGIGAHLV